MNVKVSIGEVLSDLWADLSGSQKFVTVALVLLVCGLVLGSWINTFKAWGEISGFQNDAIQAEREKQDALAKAADIAADIKVREEELFKVEVKRDEKKREVEKMRADVANDRANYDRAVRTRSTEAPSSDELCRILANAGHPCQPR